MSLLLLAGAALITYDTPLLERQRILAPFFSPAPGENVQVSPGALAIVRGKDALLTKGELKVRPPKGQCLIIRSELSKRDQKFCGPNVYVWDVFDLDGAGRLNLTIVSGPKDEGTLLTWPSPYRIANIVPNEVEQEGDSFNVPVLSCETALDQGTRKITLELMDGRRWFIYLPPFDTPTSDNAPPPNLIVRIDSKKDAQGKPQAVKHDDDESKQRRSALGALLSGEYKNVKKYTQGFHVGRRNAFEMSSSNFMESSVPQGMTGICRYMFEGAPGDPASGVIECFNTDSLASVYTHVTCFSKFSPQINPETKPSAPAPGGS